MRRVAWVVGGLVGVLVLAGVDGARADPIILHGSPTETGAKGTSASVTRLVPAPSNTVVGVNSLNGPSNASMMPLTIQHTPHLIYGGESNAAPYSFSGVIVGMGQANLRAQGSFTDELFFQTLSGLSGYLEFDFDVSYYLSALMANDGALNGSSEFRMRLLGKDDSSAEVTLDQYSDIVFYQEHCEGTVCNSGSYKSLDGIITLSTRDLGFLLASGNYFTLSFVLDAEIWNGGAQWDGSRVEVPGGFYLTRRPVLRSVRVFDNLGNRLDPKQYSLISSNGNRLPVPEPASLLLMGAGLLGLGALRRRG